MTNEQLKAEIRKIKGLDWINFKSLIGNKRTKVVKRAGKRWEFVSFNPETDMVTIIKNKQSKRLHILPRKHFEEDFELVGQLEEKPLF
jgi:thymidine kinase